MTSPGPHENAWESSKITIREHPFQLLSPQALFILFIEVFIDLCILLVCSPVQEPQGNQSLYPDHVSTTKEKKHLSKSLAHLALYFQIPQALLGQDWRKRGHQLHCWCDTPTVTPPVTHHCWCVKPIHLWVYTMHVCICVYASLPGRQLLCQEEGVTLLCTSLRNTEACRELSRARAS